VTLAGPVIAWGGPRGAVRLSNGGYAVLGQLIADVTGSPYSDAVTRLVLEPLGMRGSSFPARSADLGPDAVTGYSVTREGAFVPVPARLCSIPAVGGLWATAADLVRLGAGWSSLLPAALASEALTPQAAAEPGGHQVGLGWLISRAATSPCTPGLAPVPPRPCSSASLLIRVHDNRTQVVLTNRQVPIDPVNDRLLRCLDEPNALGEEEAHVPALPGQRPDARGPAPARPRFRTHRSQVHVRGRGSEPRQHDH
jgi:CubicO group peptidase (beta-lactamase class C family)